MPVPSYVAFEGPIAAGKTTLATLLAAHLGANLLLENFDDNEFLPDFYRARGRWALPMQLSFLIARYEQLQADLPADRWTVADHTFDKDALFATLLLTSARELGLYQRIAAALSRPVPRPRFLVYLDAPDAVLLDRIAKRGREYESTIDAPYLQNLRKAYATRLLRLPSDRYISIRTGDLNLEDKAQLVRLFSRVVEAATEPGGS